MFILFARLYIFFALIFDFKFYVRNRQWGRMRYGRLSVNILLPGDPSWEQQYKRTRARAADSLEVSDYAGCEGQ